MLGAFWFFVTMILPLWDDDDGKAMGHFRPFYFFRWRRCALYVSRKDFCSFAEVDGSSLALQWPYTRPGTSQSDRDVIIMQVNAFCLSLPFLSVHLRAELLALKRPISDPVSLDRREIEHTKI